jgi:glyoxalase family protein
LTCLKFSVARPRSAKLEEVVRGLHHVTALAGDPQRNLDFYTHFLGLRFIKRTVNFDDPGAYHFYFGDEVGTPGTIVTFFPWPNAPAGQQGSGQAAAVSLAVPRNALGDWIERAQSAQVEFEGPSTRFGDQLITLHDPAGLPVELIASEPENDTAKITRVHSAAICVAHPDPSLKFLTDVLGARPIAEEQDRTRLDLGGTPVDVIGSPKDRAKLSAGMIHHIAWKVADDIAQSEWRAKLIAAGARVTRVIDRQYFRSIYFREPGGVLFEIATEGPGFLLDETLQQLGTALKLPPWLESIRASIENRLPKVDWDA